MSHVILLRYCIQFSILMINMLFKYVFKFINKYSEEVFRQIYVVLVFHFEAKFSDTSQLHISHQLGYLFVFFFNLST